MMAPDPAAEQALPQRVAAWLHTASPPHLDDDPARRFGQLREWHEQLYTAGWLGIGWPVEHGGQPGTPVDQALVYATLALHGAPLPVGIIGLQTVGPSIIAFGTPTQRRELLPAILSGADIWCQGFSEPEAGSDLASLRTRARRTDAGYVIDGQKTWTSWAQYADRCALLARTGTSEERHRGLTYFIVDMAADGVEVRPIHQINGEAEFNEVFLDGVVVPETAVIGAEGHGWPVALTTLESERATYAISRHAELRAGFEALMADVPVGRAAPVTDLGWAEVTLEVLAALSRTASRGLTAGYIGAESATYKLATSQLEQDLGSHERSIARHLTASGEWTPATQRARARAQHDYLTSRSATIHGGTAEILRGVIAQRVLGLPRDRSGGG